VFELAKRSGQHAYSCLQWMWYERVLERVWDQLQPVRSPHVECGAIEYPALAQRACDLTRLVKRSLIFFGDQSSEGTSGSLSVVSTISGWRVSVSYGRPTLYVYVKRQLRRSWNGKGVGWQSDMPNR